jgi:hypothetical protein
VRRQFLQAAQWLLGAVVLYYAGRQIVRHWDDVRAVQVNMDLQALPIAVALGLVWLGFAALISAWRLTVHASGTARVRWPDAARIWAVSSLGKYLPGKVWAMAGLLVLARDAGIAGRAAAGAAIFQQIVAIGTGALMVAITGRHELMARLPGGGLALAALAGGAMVLTLLPLSARVMLRLERMMDAAVRARGAAAADAGGAGPVAATDAGEADPGAAGRTETRAIPARDGRDAGGASVTAATGLPVRVLVASIGANMLAWVAYGASLCALLYGVLPSVGPELTLARAIGGFGAAYVAGVLAVLAPGGLGVREGLLVLLLAPAVGEGAALLVALGSRILFTVAELVAAAPFLFLAKEKDRVGS